jgi:regulatory protein
MERYYEKSEAIELARRYCVYQERCHSEVRNKLLELGQRGNDLEDCLSQLIEENYLNEERFAKAFAGGHFRMKQWGRKKIEAGLRAKSVSNYCIKKGLEEIDEKDYLNSLKTIISKKSDIVHERNERTKKSKLAEFAIGKGYESNLVWAVLNQSLEEE